MGVTLFEKNSLPKTGKAPCGAQAFNEISDDDQKI